jgi:hypothetical protein
MNFVAASIVRELFDARYFHLLIIRASVLVFRIVYATRTPDDLPQGAKWAATMKWCDLSLTFGS